MENIFLEEKSTYIQSCVSHEVYQPTHFIAKTCMQVQPFILSLILTSNNMGPGQGVVVRLQCVLLAQ
jgi:hypothetical protein